MTASAPPWESRGMRWAFAFAAATLNFLPVWRTLLYAAEDERYFIVTRYPVDHAAAILLTIGFAVLVYALVEGIRRLPEVLSGWAMLALIAVVAIAPLNFVRIVATGYGVGMRQFALYTGVAVVIALPFLFRMRHRFAAPVFTGVAIFTPLAALYLAQAAWGFATGSSERIAPARAASVEARADAPRVVWVIFDELDGRLLREPRGGFTYPEFDRLRSESISATRVVPPGGGTIRAMPAYWLGRPVAEGAPAGAAELIVTLEGEGDQRLTELDHVYRVAAARGHAIGIVGFYHPYCRLFGDFAQRCAEFAYRDVGHRESTGWIDSMLTGAVALHPMWRRIGGARIFRSVRDEGLAMTGDASLDFVTIHVNVPHDPPLFDAEAGELTVTGRNASYPSSILLADRMLGKIRAAIRESTVAGRTTLVVASDHGWRPESGYESEAGAVPLFVALPGQRAGRTIDVEIAAIGLRDVMLGVLSSELVGPNAVEARMRSRQP